MRSDGLGRFPLRRFRPASSSATSFLPTSPAWMSNPPRPDPLLPNPARAVSRPLDPDDDRSGVRKKYLI